jgi:hypothetical protein
MLLPTVRSRCAVTHFAGYSDGELLDIIERSFEHKPPARLTTLFIRLSGGNPGYAAELAQSETFLSHREELIRMLCGHLDGDARASHLLASFLEKNRERFRRHCGIMIYWLRDLWLRSAIGTRGGGGCGGSGGSDGSGGGCGSSGGCEGDGGCEGSVIKARGVKTQNVANAEYVENAKYVENAEYVDNAAGAEGIVNSDMMNLMNKYDGRFRPGALLESMARIDDADSAVSANANFSLAVNAMLYSIMETLNAGA